MRAGILPIAWAGPNPIRYGRTIRLRSPAHAAADSRHRLIRYADGFEELYDLAEDPHEFTNRATDPALAGVKARLSEALPARAASSVGTPVQSSYNLRKTPGKKAKSSK